MLRGTITSRIECVAYPVSWVIDRAMTSLRQRSSQGSCCPEPILAGIGTSMIVSGSLLTR
jgi:hypothetical protein